MTKAKIRSKPRANQSKYYEEFETIKDTPQNVAKVIMRKPPKKNWRFMEQKNKVSG